LARARRDVRPGIEQLEHRISVGELAKRARIGAGAHGEISLNGKRVAIEIGLEDVELLVAGHGAKTKSPAGRRYPDPDVAPGLGSADPFRPPAGRDGKPIAPPLQ